MSIRAAARSRRPGVTRKERFEQLPQEEATEVTTRWQRDAPIVQVRTLQELLA